MNATNFFEEIPECVMATVMIEMLERFLGLRPRHPSRTMLLHRVDVKTAFHQLPVDPAKGRRILGTRWGNSC